ncbi:MAG: hypothetical protein PHV16_01535 [Candidatus Nanoarchaeia archaeon]|nr:hypothetical protein [Candidatus Nanoarchaeia archaeon]
MKKKVGYLILGFFIVLLGFFIFSERGLKTISGYVVMKANESNPLAFYVVLGIIMLIAAVLSYIYSVKKYGPA